MRHKLFRCPCNNRNPAVPAGVNILNLIDKKESDMPHNKTVVLWSQPFIAGRSLLNDLKNGMGTLLVANISNRPIVANYEFHDQEGSICSDGYGTVQPGCINAFNSTNDCIDSRKYMYCKLWFDGSRHDIRASLIMSTLEGPPGSEVEAPVYGVALE